MNVVNSFLKLVEQAEAGCGHCDLETHSFCAGLSDEGRRSLRDIRGGHHVDAHEAVFQEDEQADHLYALVSGTVKLSKLLGDGRRQIIGFLFSGDFFGFAPSGTYACTAEALTPLSLCRFSRVRMSRLMTSMPELEHRLLERLAGELAAAQDQMLLLGRMTAREKVAHFLLTLSRKAEERGEQASPVEMPMSRLDMADYLGLTVETVSRTFSILKREGFIVLHEPTVVGLRDISGLRRIAEGTAAA